MDKVKTSKLQILRRDFETLSMKDTDSVDCFYTHVIGLMNHINSHGETIEDRKVVEKALRSLPSKFYTLVVTLEDRKDLSQFSLDERQASLINHEHKLSMSNMSLENAFSTQSSISRGRGRGRANYRGGGRIVEVDVSWKEVDATAVLEILVEEDKVKITVSQVVIGVKSQRFNSITVKNMDIMHMNAGRDNIIRTNKVKINRTTQIVPPVLCLWHALKKFL
jgi:hypothetical protein